MRTNGCGWSIETRGINGSDGGGSSSNIVNVPVYCRIRGSCYCCRKLLRLGEVDYRHARRQLNRDYRAATIAAERHTLRTTRRIIRYRQASTPGACGSRQECYIYGAA